MNFGPLDDMPLRAWLIVVAILLIVLIVVALAVNG